MMALILKKEQMQAVISIVNKCSGPKLFLNEKWIGEFDEEHFGALCDALLAKKELTELSLSKNYLSTLKEKQWKKLCEYIKECHLEFISLAQNIIYSPYLSKLLFSAINQNTTLKWVDFFGCSLDSRWDEFCEFVFTNKGLTSLTFSLNNLWKLDAIQWFRFFEALRSNRTIERLWFNEQAYIDILSADEVWDKFLDAVKQHPSILFIQTSIESPVKRSCLESALKKKIEVRHHAALTFSQCLYKFELPKKDLCLRRIPKPIISNILSFMEKGTLAKQVMSELDRYVDRISKISP